MRRSSAGDRDEYAPGQFTDEEDDDTTPQDRRSDQRTWYTRRWGDLEEHISDLITREEFVESGYVVKHRGRTYDRDPHIMSRTGAHGAPKRVRLQKIHRPHLTWTPTRSHWEHAEINRSRYGQGWWYQRAAT